MKKVIRLLLLIVIILQLVACGNKDSTPNSNDLVNNDKATVTDNINSSLLGYYECIGSDMQGNKFDPIGEWLELKDDGSGKWFLGATEDNFKWTSNDKEINFDVEVAGSEIALQYKATIEDDQIILNTGMLYYFEKSGSTEAKSNNNNSIALGIQPAGKIEIPSNWYGVAILSDCVGCNFEDEQLDIWASIDKDADGNAFFEIYLGVEQEFVDSPLLSMYIDKEERTWLTPTIGDKDAWLNGVYLNKDDEWVLLTQYDQGALDIYYTYEEEGKSANYRFFIREYGTAWNEETDPLPYGYAAYAAEFYGPSNNVAKTGDSAVTAPGLDNIAIDIKDMEINFGSDDYGKDGRVYTSTGTMEMQIPENWEVGIALDESSIGVKSPDENSDIIRASTEDYSSMIKNPADRTPENQAKESAPSGVNIIEDKWGNTKVYYYIYEWSDYTEIRGFADYSNEQYLSFDMRAKTVNGTVDEFMKSDAWNTLRTTFELSKP